METRIQGCMRCSPAGSSAGPRGLGSRSLDKVTEETLGSDRSRGMLLVVGYSEAREGWKDNIICIVHLRQDRGHFSIHTP
jgi:hypothetical protein